jgi:hypothetical protein
LYPSATFVHPGKIPDAFWVMAQNGAGRFGSDRKALKEKPPT